MKKLLLLGVLYACPAAHAEVFGDWMVDNLPAEKAVYAATVNDVGGLLGKTCSSDGCRWITTNKVGCKDGAQYPAIMNADSGAWHITLVCSPNETNPGRYVILEYEFVDKAVSTGDSVGIAMPLESGNFRVARYPSKGWSGAERKLRERAANLLKRMGESTL